MKTWRVLGLICALCTGLAACGDSNKEELDSSLSPSRGDGGDGGADAEEPTEDLDAEMTAPPPEADAGDNGLDAAEACVPQGCRELGANCGMADDGCGGTVDCGMCKEDFQTCGGGGKKNVCGCTPATCESLSSERGAKVCGTIPDGCGGTVDCGNSCTGTETCGGGAAANQCGCQPNINACGGKECGTADDGCGKQVQCGSNNGQCSANKECNSAQACVCKTDQSAFCAGKCGNQQTPDGCSVNCGSCTTQCAAGDGVSCASCDCPSPGICRTGSCCVPETTAALCGTATCGTRTNRCGQTVSCGTCGTGTSCSPEGRCESPAEAALIGKYAVKTVGFVKAVGVVSRGEGLALVNIYRAPDGKLMMQEQACYSIAYTRRSSCTAQNVCEDVVATFPVETSTKALPTTIELDLSQGSSWSGPKEWVRPVQPASQNVNGWRRGRPSYCPADGGPPDPSHPDYGPPGGGPRALGARKPWLNGAACRCPAQEFAARGTAGTCQGLSDAPARRMACMMDRENLSLPFSPGPMASADSDVTDCRVVDDDLDGLPGGTAEVVANFLGTNRATVRSASVAANVLWGQIDTSPSKAHWGVVQDQVGLQSANVACLNLSGPFADSLCGASSGNICPAYPPGATPTKANRVNPIEFVSLHDKTAPTGGWAGPGQSPEASCAEIYAKRNDPAWFPNVAWHTRYPDQAAPYICTASAGRD